MDFFTIAKRPTKRGVMEIYPKFIIKSPSNDLMIRGGDFYAVWCEDKGLWSTDEQDVIDIVDRALDEYANAHRSEFEGNIRVLHMWDAESGIVDIWHKYCQRQMRDSFHTLDEKIVWKEDKVNKKDYASKRLDYPLKEGEFPSWNRLIGTLYSEEERHKIEWAIGAIVDGASKKLQKFLVLYGEAGTGKSTILNVIQELFDGYYSVFDSKALGSSSASFALEPFKCNPLVAIQHDGDLSRIEDNTRLNSLVSHETMTVNNKFEKLYSTKFKCFLFMGTNKPVKITDAKSGLLRRLIDVSPSGEKIPRKEYNQLVEKVKFELGAIAWHCREVYLEDPGAYDDYVPLGMMGESNDFYNYMEDNYFIFKQENGTTLKAAWDLYKTFCEDAKLGYPLSKTRFKSELRNYFDEYLERYTLEDGTRVRNYYKGLKVDKFESVDISKEPKKKEKFEIPDWLNMTADNTSLCIFEKEFSDCKAQYTKADESPKNYWAKVKTTLFDIDKYELHYVLVPETLVVVDLDIRDPKTGKKSFDLNVKEAAKWPKTYAELSKGGQGIHLHYFYTGDPTELSCVYGENIEIKTFTGNGALRRKLSKCNDIPIATINSGLPLKERSKKDMINFEKAKNEEELTRRLTHGILKAINKEVHASTTQNINFIEQILNDAYAGDIPYDVSGLMPAVRDFALNSTNQKDKNLAKVVKMPFKSKEYVPEGETEYDPLDLSDLIIFDIEVAKNVLLVCWKLYGKDKKVVRMFNPSQEDIEELLRHKLAGYNCRRYDNHILYERKLGGSNRKCYDLSKAIVTTKKGEKGPFHPEAWNASFVDIYDMASKKQSLKKWEIELHQPHKEWAIDWNEPIPEELWPTLADYCENDVLATEALFDHLQADFMARVILSIMADGCPNDTTNSLTTKIVFGDNRTPQNEFNYRFMGDTSTIDIQKTRQMIEEFFAESNTRDNEEFDEFTVFDSQGRPVFPGYLYKDGVSTYRGEEIGEGGYVYAEQGVWTLVGLDDVASMHPSSAEDEALFGPYTKNFSAIKQLRVYIKHHDFESAKKLLFELLCNLYSEDKAKRIMHNLDPYFTEEQADALAYALKIAINSVYGLTAAKFPNPFKDPRNEDNIVAKRGALFMVNLKHEVQKRGFTVAHIKTDSIKIPNATPYILDFVYRYGKMYGYTFEHEATYEKMCLVNDAVYIAQYAMPEQCKELYGYIPGDNTKHFKKHNHPWTATGAQFQVPYVFKQLFSKEPIEFDDMCETKEVKKGEIYIDMNESLPNVEQQEKDLKKLQDKYADGLISDTTYDPEFARLTGEIAKGHNYVFVGKVGSFCPIVEGANGGELVCLNNGKYSAVTGSKGYRWLEAEMVRTLGKEESIDRGYYRELCDDAWEKVNGYCRQIGRDFDWFVDESEVDESKQILPADKGEITSCDPDFMNVPEGVEEEIPWVVKK